MKVKAAVLREVGKPCAIEELELADPKRGEVLVRYAYCGFCHSDLSFMTGSVPSFTPMVPGHECSGIVEEVGPEVTRVKKGDHVVGTYSIPCGECAHCLQGRSHLCPGTQRPFLEGTLLDGTTRFSDKQGSPVHTMLYLSGFASHSVVPEGALIPIGNEVPLDQACLLGCCVPTGWGSVMNIARIKPGESVAVYGLGGIGLNIVRAAVLAHANPVIAVDIESSKEALAYEFGATHFICNGKEDPVPRIQALTAGGAQFVFEAIGDPGAIVQAWWSTGISGRLIVPGVTPLETITPLPLFLLPLHGKAIMGSGFGETCAAVDIPRYADMIMHKNLLKLDKLITRKFKIEQINDVTEAMTNKQIQGRWVCAWE
jgi:S-(hydroxymethyl)glutathione dehydrogenase / alcohol dehydrogenase